MSYTNRLIDYAKRLEQSLSIDRDAATHKYKVYINLVGYKDKYVRMSVWGMGFTIEDACGDYLRKVCGGKLTHYIHNTEVDVL